MSIGNIFKNAKSLIAIIIALVVTIALAVTLVVFLNRDNDDLPPTDGTTQSTDPAGTKPNATEPNATEPVKPTTYTVTFKDHNGKVLGTQEVEEGKAAAAPAEPTREHFTFAGWDKTFDKVTGDLVITATYTTTKTVIYAESVTVDKSAKQATVNIRVLNNPGIMGAVLKIAVDDKVFTFAEGKNTQYPGLTLTCPGSGTTASPYKFMLDALELSADDEKDGTLFAVTFNIKDAAEAGSYNIVISYENGDIFDKNYKDPKVVLENGTITIG